ncbi:murein L,D-transpeptidase [Chitinophaga sp. GbtcB8]|uniref:L,D-transpeptidase family protein n=1 Tax=Chitinophaga sp. GbtcB8 TaxID=2824753 RepID=UPI001C30319E|nr:L,D-transpeptidase family protein [Chitinophaga sp. GbtcB8]
MQVRNLLFWPGIVLILWISACRQSGVKGPLGRDSTHYTGQEYLDRMLDSNTLQGFLKADSAYHAYSDQIQNFYRKRSYHYAWISNEGRLTEQAGNFLNMISNDEPAGTPDSKIVNPALRKLYDKVTEDSSRVAARDITTLEMMLTGQFFAYGNKEWAGMTADTAKDLEWFIPRKKLDIETLLDSLVQEPNNTFEEPVNRYYITLRSALKKLVAMEEHTHWDSIHADKKLYKKGDSAAVVSVVKNRLYAWGDLKAPDTSALFTPALDTAIRKFQERMGLAVNGTIQQPVLNALNVSLQQRIQQILLNMERMRWIPVDPGKEYLLVNIPAFKLYAYENGQLAWSCNVVVGKPGASTVIFTRPMQFIVFSPYWNVTPSIIAHEILPAIKRNPGYLARQNMEVVGASGKEIPAGSISWGKYSGNNFPYIIRQKPGGANALGKVKFLFPNEYNIYLHDTPSRHLFGETKRSFSHGCIRVGEPQHLAEWLLRNDLAWTKDKIVKAMNAAKEQYVPLKNKIPVFIGYFTAYVDSQGQLNFRDDVYGHDARLAAQLFGK